MHVAIGTDALKAALSKVRWCTSKASTVPMSKNVLIDATGSAIDIEGNAYDISVAVSLPNEKIYEAGAFCTRIELLFDIVAKMQGDEISIKGDAQDGVTIRCGRSKYVIPAFEPDTFTRINMNVGKEIFHGETQCDSLVALVNNTIWAAPKEEKHNHTMDCTFLEANDGKLLATCTDGYRMAHNHMPADVQGAGGVLIITDLLFKTEKIFGSFGEGRLLIKAGEAGCLFMVEGTTARVSSFSEKYFSYKQFFGRKTEFEATVCRKDIIESMSRFGILLRENVKAPCVFEIKEDGEIAMSIRSQLGTLHETIDAKVTGKPGFEKIGFNPSFIAEMLRYADGDEATLGFGDAKTPVIVRGDGYQFLVLPVNVG